MYMFVYIYIYKSHVYMTDHSSLGFSSIRMDKQVLVSEALVDLL